MRITGGGVALYNVLLNSLSLMLTFGAFQTSTFIEATVLTSEETPNINPKDGARIAFTGIAIYYLFFALGNMISPAIVSITGDRLGMIFGCIPYCLFMGALIYPYAATIYIVSILQGVGAATLWTSQGKFLTSNSTDRTMSRNTGIFWAFLQGSLVFGNLTIYYLFGDVSVIGNKLRMIIYGLLTGVALLGTLILFCLKNTPKLDEENEMENIGDLSRLSRRTENFYTPSPIKAISA